MAKYSNVTNGQNEAILNIIGGEEALMKILADSALATKISLAIKELIAGTATYLTPLYVGETIMVPATKGSVTLVDSSATFPGFLDADLKNWQTNKAGKNTKPQAGRILEQSRDGNFQQMFKSLGPLDRSVMTQGQIAAFCVTHWDKLRQEGWGTFFLFKVGAEYFVAYVSVDAVGRLGLRVYRLDDSGVWDAQRRHRVVVPKLDV